MMYNCIANPVYCLCHFSTSSSGNEYVGEWVEGVRHGKGKFSWSNQNVSIAGNWVNGVLVRLSLYYAELHQVDSVRT